MDRYPSDLLSTTPLRINPEHRAAVNIRRLSPCEQVVLMNLLYATSALALSLLTGVVPMTTTGLSSRVINVIDANENLQILAEDQSVDIFVASLMSFAVNAEYFLPMFQVRPSKVSVLCKHPKGWAIRNDLRMLRIVDVDEMANGNFLALALACARFYIKARERK